MLQKTMQQAADRLGRLLTASARPLMDHAGECSRTYALMADEKSRTAYSNQLMCLALTKVVGAARAAILSDSISREEFEALAVKASRDPALPKMRGGPDWVRFLNMACTWYLEQYRYDDIVDVMPGDVFLDCGACLGDTAIWAARKGARVWSFDVDENTLPFFDQNIERAGVRDRVVLTRAAVGEHDGTAFFFCDTGNPGGSHICNREKGSPVPMVALDSFCARHKLQPTYIKMDIEGAELAALRGAEQIIREYRPRLAVCLYHNIHDMWEIPLWLDQLGAGYRFYCRKNHPEYEFILYAACPPLFAGTAGDGNRF